MERRIKLATLTINHCQIINLSLIHISQPNKYKAALTKYNTNLSDADIQARVAELIEKKVPENNTEDVYKRQ